MTALANEKWGERRERDRKQRRRVFAGVMLAVAIGFTTLLPDSASAQTKAVVMAGVMLVVLVGAWLNWRERDEVERRAATNCYATMGFAMLIGMPLGRVAVEGLQITDARAILSILSGVWLVSAIAGLGVYVVQRVRT